MRIRKNSLTYEWHVHGYFLYGVDADSGETVEIAELGAMDNEAELCDLVEFCQYDLAEAYGFEITEG